MDLDAALAILSRTPEAPLDVAEITLYLAKDEYPDVDVDAHLGELAAMAHEAQRYVRGDLAVKVAHLGLSIGDQILLYQDEDDFEVIATLDFRFVENIGLSTWVAYPDWTTVCRQPSGPEAAASHEAGRKVA